MRTVRIRSFFFQGALHVATRLYRLRCAGTPWCLILTPDYRECIRAIVKDLQAKPEGPPSFWTWDFLRGHACIFDIAETTVLGAPDDTVQAPALLLKKLVDLPPNSVFFFIVPKNELIEDMGVIQGIANAS